MTQPPNNQFPGTPQQPDGNPFQNQDPNVPQHGAPQGPGDQASYGAPAGQPAYGAPDGPQSGTPDAQPGYAQSGQQPGYGQQDPQAGYAPQGGFEQAPQGVFEEPKKKNGVLNIIKIVAGVIILAVGGFFIWQNFASEAALEPGKCIVITGDDVNDVDHKEVKCDDDKQASFVVAEVFDSSKTCTEGSQYTITSKGRRSGTRTKTTCLIPNFLEGKCYAENSSASGIELVDCSSADASFKISKVENSGDATCTDADPIAFPKFGRTFCLAQP